MHQGRFARWLMACGVGAVLGVAGFWFLERREEGTWEGAEEPTPETEAHRQVRGAVLHNVSRDLVEEVLRMEAEEKRVAETVWAKEMLAQECGRTFERLWDEINAVTNRLRLGADSAVEGGGQLHREHREGGTEGTESGEGITQRAEREEEGGSETAASLEEEGGSTGLWGKLQVVAQLPVDEVMFGRWDSVEELPHGIEVIRSSVVSPQKYPSPQPSPLRGAREEGSGGEVLSGRDWKTWVEGKMREGWRLEQVEFRHHGFEVSEEKKPARSVFYFVANLMRTAVGENGREGNGKGEERVSLEGDLVVEWGVKGEDGFWGVRRVDASGLVLKRRVGRAVFELVLDEVIAPREQERWIDPLMVYDLDGDGGSEVVLVARNLVFKRNKSYTESTEGEAQRARREEGGKEEREGEMIHASESDLPDRGRWESRELCRFPEGFVGSAVLAEVTGDGRVDLVVAKWEGVFVFEGAGGGVFPEKARLGWKAQEPIRRAMVMTCGDVDGDGDVDLFLGQYKDPYEGGVTPRPFYDSNDGYPGYLLVNQGRGVFADGTVTAGLERKRNRRTFSASLVDLDRDGDLDLMVVSDFAGMDFYVNDGKGRFRDVTEDWVPRREERLGFGMAHRFADFNGDGRLDVLMIGMTSATMDRLSFMGLMRARDGRERELEVAMTYGNRLLFGRSGGGFAQGEMSESIARAGWAWGCGSLDFDGDGWEDVYVANGFQSWGTVRDSEGDYWLHDRFLESELGAQATDLYFRSSGARGRGEVRSFGGHERNRLYWNRGGTNFVEVGYLLGVSVGEDSRNVAADDLDGDGRTDLVMTTMEVWPKERQTLKIFRNGLADGKGKGELGKERRVYVTGDGFRSQGPVERR